MLPTENKLRTKETKPSETEELPIQLHFEGEKES